MPSSKIERKLAAIMFTDIAGYTAQMSKDEDKAFALIQKKRDLLLPLVEKHEGKLIKEIGDGTLTRYFKADNAIDCASTFQSQTDTDLNVRAGIHTGEVIVDKEDVFGDVVNVASRLESIAVPGSVLVSKETIDKLEMSDKVELVSLGMQSLKGVGRLIEVYAIKDDSLVVPNPEDYIENKIKVHSDDEVPSIAIIPFDNKGADEDVFYAYGISADLISDVSSAGLIRVASKTDIAKLDYQYLDNSELSQKLDVRYIANGELWRMGEMFQLSVELYDTKDKKVVWSDRWQEKWDNLPTIKGSLSDGLLKVLDTKPQVEQQVDTTNAEAYEIYLQAKYQYEKRENTDDIEIARGLLHKAIELDGNLLAAKNLLGTTYREMGEYDKAMEIYKDTLEQVEASNNVFLEGLLLSSIGTIYYYKRDFTVSLKYYEKSYKIRKKNTDKRGTAKVIGNIGNVYYLLGEYDIALHQYQMALEIEEHLEDQRGIGYNLGNIGLIYNNKCDVDQTLNYYKNSLDFLEKIDDKVGICRTYFNLGVSYHLKGNINRALKYFENSISLQQKLGDKRSMLLSNIKIGLIYFDKGEHKKMVKFLDKAISLQKEINLGHDVTLMIYTFLYITYKGQGKIIDKKKIYNLIKYAEYIEFDLNYHLYELLEEPTYLKTAYSQVQEKANNLEPNIAAKFLSYPIPKVIVEEWEKVK